MIKLKQIQMAIQTILYSPYVKHEKPVSAVLVAEPEHNKSVLLKSFVVDDKKGIINKGILFSSDFTAYGIMKYFGDKIKNGEIKVIVCPEFLKIISRKQSSVNDTLAFLNSLIEEGLMSISTYATQKEFKVPVKCGFITAITKEQYDSKRRLFKNLGFLSRIIPISYKYGDGTKDQIFNSIYNEEYHNDKAIPLKFPSKPQKIKIARKYCKRINPIVKRIATDSGLQGFRLQKNLQCLMKASALMNQRHEVEEQDYENVREMTEWINFGTNPKII